jgi:hypothetical protein
VEGHFFLTADNITRIFLHALAIICIAAFANTDMAASAARVPLPPPRAPDLVIPGMQPSKTMRMDDNVTASIPLPPQRPADLATPPRAKAPSPDTPPPSTATIAPSPQDNEGLRAQLLASGRISGKDLPPIAEKIGCGMAAPLQMDAVLQGDGTKVVLSPPATLRASLASAFADWIRDDLAPAIAATGDRLIRIEGIGGYECRGRDRIAGAKLSEHAFGNALDLEAFVTERGKHLAIAGPRNSVSDDVQSFLALMKKTACPRFMTVLGPGSDAYHAQHLHIDLEERRHGTHICQWTSPDLAAKAGASGQQ